MAQRLRGFRIVKNGFRIVLNSNSSKKTSIYFLKTKERPVFSLCLALGSVIEKK